MPSDTRNQPSPSSGAGIGSRSGLVAELRNISKRFGAVQALNDVSIDVRRGEILGIAGENGSGKSTLMKVLSGAYHPDCGEVVLNGELVRLKEPVDALHRGIALVAQEVQVQPELTVAENVLSGRLMKNRLGMADWRRSLRAAKEILNSSLGLELDPQARLGNLTLHHQHLVSIAAMLHRRPETLILDEPTASLPHEYVDKLFEALHRFRADGGSVIYITHRLIEYVQLCDRTVILRDGEYAAERSAEETDVDTIVQLMVGRQLSDLFERPEKPQPEGPSRPTLRAIGLNTPKLRDINIEVASGEIVGVAGQAGAGRSTLARTLFGAEPYTGSIEIDGKARNLRSPTSAIAAGIGYVPDDRKGAGLVLTSSIHDNLTMPSWPRLSRSGLSSRGSEAKLVSAAIDDLRINTPSPSIPVSSLSGGNQQKVVLAKWMANDPRLLILDEPTRGVDVGAKDEIYRLIDELAADGVAVLVLSSEALELIRLSDRIVVMNSGRIVGSIPGDQASEESIVAMAFSDARSEKKG